MEPGLELHNYAMRWRRRRRWRFAACDCDLHIYADMRVVLWTLRMRRVCQAMFVMNIAY